MTFSSRLSVNVNAVALLRNRRHLPWPSVIESARIVMIAGTKGITAHPRPDGRHILKQDVADLAVLIKEEFPDRELCLEGYPDAVFLNLVEKYRPTQVLYVPDDPSQQTSDHGWDFERDWSLIRNIVIQTKEWGIRTALFIDPDPGAVEKAAQVGADRVEIYTGRYGASYADTHAAARELDQIVKTGKKGLEMGLAINAGHDLTVENVPALISQAPFIKEVSIGHAFIADALIHGLTCSVNRYRKALGEVCGGDH